MRPGSSLYWAVAEAARMSPRLNQRALESRAMNSRPVPQPADLDVVRDSYDRVADDYVDMVTTGVGDIRTHPWLRAAMIA